jgi:hypothetical protein
VLWLVSNEKSGATVGVAPRQLKAAYRQTG